MKIMNLREIKNLSEDELSALITRTIKVVRAKQDIKNLKTIFSATDYYLDLLSNGTYLISVNENPIEVCLNESVALKRFEEITS